VAGGTGMTCHEFAQTSAILEFYIWFRFWPYHRSRSTCYYAPVCEILSKSDHAQQKQNDVMSIFKWRIAIPLSERLIQKVKWPVSASGLHFYITYHVLGLCIIDECVAAPWSHGNRGFIRSTYMNNHGNWR